MIRMNYFSRCGLSLCLKEDPLLLHHIQKRFKIRKKDHWAVLRRKNFPTDLALQNFDQFYKPVYGKRWPSIRLALLCQEKHCALLNSYVEWEQKHQTLQEMGCLDMRATFENEQSRLQKRKQAKRKEQQLRKIKEMAEEFTNIKATRLSETSKQSSDERLINEGVMAESTLLGSYVPATEIRGMEDWVEEDDYLKHYPADDDLPFNVISDAFWSFPEQLRVRVFPRGDVTVFPHPARDVLDVSDSYMMDGASLLPVLALDVQHGDSVLDLCAAPGGKALAILQTMHFGSLLCNDSSISRTNRLKAVVRSYIPSCLSIRNDIKITSMDATMWTDFNAYDKVLVDVPCTNDRLSANENDNNWFKLTRIKERTQLPELQSALLFTAIRAAKPGGTVVYSTCSLSPVQNDGVVHMALTRIWRETDIQVQIVDTSASIAAFHSIFWFMRGLRYGQLVLPTLVNNFGPTYFCKIKRIP